MSLPQTDLAGKVSARRGAMTPKLRAMAGELVDKPAVYARMTSKEICDALQTSEPTLIRLCRDLGYSGIAEFRIELALSANQHGNGAEATNPNRSPHDSVASSLASLAVELLDDDRAILLGDGSLIEAFASRLGQTRPLHIVATGLRVAQAALKFSQHAIILTGGRIDPKSLSLNGRLLDDAIARMRFDTFFLDAINLDPIAGLSSRSEDQAHEVRRMMEVSKRVVVLAGQSQFKAPDLHLICPPEWIDVLVTDIDTTTEAATRLVERGVRIKSTRGEIAPLYARPVNIRQYPAWPQSSVAASGPYAVAPRTLTVATETLPQPASSPTAMTQLGIVPCPNSIRFDGVGEAAGFHAADDAETEELDAMRTVLSLHRRLFPSAEDVLTPGARPSSRPVSFVESTEIEPEGYRLYLSEHGVTLRYREDRGRFYGLVTLAQIAHAAMAGETPMPLKGEIADRPRFAWRGAMLDVARHFFPAADVMRFLDVMSWHKLNRFHWHLTDDEGWRIESLALPGLTDHEGNVRQFYTQAEVATIVEHARSLAIEVMPEYNMPGHSSRLLSTALDLVDPAEPPASYRSHQGFPNNALNPAVPGVLSTIERLIDEFCSLFPSSTFHVGWDEIEANAWKASPLAIEEAARRGLANPNELRFDLLRQVERMLKDRGKKLAGWDDCAERDVVDKDAALVFAWQKPEHIAELMKRGYNVVATPAQRYYLDIRQSDKEGEPGETWAGSVSPRDCYEHEPLSGIPAEIASRLKGIQGCLWTALIKDKATLTYMAMPRLAAIAESAWTEPGNKHWARFARAIPTFPSL
ncbi:family 20 glycosylhydrolase [Mesorhizobium australafricanum]|uniref:beta-N-acetylhexosaminidase n=1 Tax=Mesorhizobium australafricanum TaxID=3072311 RepID=A0ABU4X1Z1_9HYPH|nr:family 20 glycosylhydrolase [Mesorhizobium sp. VK3E]MDX8442337.1 family 20 glycosylhydrolase [Mesorhizobium sp. VK3E]